MKETKEEQKMLKSILKTLLLAAIITITMFMAGPLIDCLFNVQGTEICDASTGDDPTDTLPFVMAFVLGIFIFYVLPSIIAIYRKHPNVVPVVLINLFLGWTLIGWIVAIIWSATAIDTSKTYR